MTGRRRWSLRAGVGVGAFALLVAGARVVDGRVDEVRLALVIALLVCASALVVDATAAEPAVWTAYADDQPGLRRVDPRTASYVRIIESQLLARTPDGALRGRLRELVELSLRARHDLVVDDPRVEEMLGTELSRVLSDPPRRLTIEEIERCTERIEKL